MHALQNVLRPGSREFVIVLNAVLALLAVVMLTVIYTELEDSFHVFLLLFLVIGLTISINWFIIETNKVRQVADGKEKHIVDPNARAKTD
uniref:Uncharacterized protein n=1 Tax=Hyaloperonospora arabidopsidis (strain Emoy2) TaxID=559515 RepID=M4BVZ1_HYAAE